MTSVTVRVAAAGDVDAIRTVVLQAYAKWAALIGREPLPMKADYAEAIKIHRFDLLYVGETLAALIETSKEEDCLLIVNVAVLPAYQGQGLGTRLLKLAETLAAADELSSTRLYTNKLYAENIRLYEALGYRLEREEELNGGVAVHMTKRIAKA